MDIKIRFTKKGGFLVAGLFLCGVIALGGWYVSPLKARHDIKATCKSNCDCFGNIVDYRLTNDQVRSFSKFIKEIEKRKNVNVLEFMDATDAIRIQQAFEVCRPQVQAVAAQQAVTNQVNAEQQAVANNETRNKK